MVDVSFYMLVEEEGSFSLALYDSEKNVISNFSNLRQNVVNDYIENLENEKEFFISWDEKKSEYLSIDSTLLKYLLENGNFVNSDFEKIEKSELTNISLLIRENREIEDKLDIFIEINDNLLSKKNIIDNYIYSQGVFYEVKGLGEFTLDELFQKIDKYELETYCSLILKNYNNVELKYEDYETINAEEKLAIPQTIIEKTSFVYSLYLKFNSIISTIDYEFFT